MTSYPADLLRCPCRKIVASDSQLVAADYTVPPGAIQVHIGVPTGASCNIDGVPYVGEVALNLPDLAFGVTDRRYPAVAITNVVGNIIVREER